MNIQKTSNQQTFNGLKIHDNAYFILMAQSEIFLRAHPHEMKVFFSKLDRCKQNEYADVFVKSDGSVFLKDKKTKKTSEVISLSHPKVAYCNLYIACAKADMLKECYEKGINPYKYMD